MKHAVASLALAAGLLLAGAAEAQSADALDPLLRLLVQNKVITLDQAMAVQKEYGELKTVERTKTVDEVNKKMDTSTKYDFGKGITFKKGDMSLNIGGRLQARYDSGADDGDALGKVFGSIREGKDDTFDIRRARISFQGALTKSLSYKFQYDIASSGVLKDAEITWKPVAAEGAFGMTAGQFKVPFGREQINSSGDLQFVDRSIVDAFFHPERDRGFMIHGQTPGKQIFGYNVGVWNSEGENKRNDDGDFRWAARVNVDPFGYMKPSQGDIDRSQDPKLSFGLQYLHDEFSGATAERDSYGIDFAFAFKGFYMDGEWVTATHDIIGGDDFDADGLRFQAGFMLYKNMIELAARYASVSADFPGDETFVGEGPDWFAGRGFKTLGKTTAPPLPGDPIGGAIYEDVEVLTLGLSFYFKGHASKLQLDYNWVDEDGYGAAVDDLDNDFFRVQYQIKF